MPGTLELSGNPNLLLEALIGLIMSDTCEELAFSLGPRLIAMGMAEAPLVMLVGLDEPWLLLVLAKGKILGGRGEVVSVREPADCAGVAA